MVKIIYRALKFHPLKENSSLIGKVIRAIQIIFRVSGRYNFKDRSKRSENLCVIIAGHKPFIWEYVFPRLAKFIPIGMDVVLLVPGKNQEILEKLAKKYGWSYLNVFRNNINLAQNIAVILHEKAKYIYKLDEDMFITKNFFEYCRTLYDFGENNLDCEIGFVSTLINVNGYGYRKILEELGAKTDYEEKFGKVKITAGSADKNDFTKNSAVARYIWGKCQDSGTIDEISSRLKSDNITFSICPIRYSIGAILYKKSLLLEMDYFKWTRGNGVSIDEIQLCSHCNMTSKVTLIGEDMMIGHLCYGPQTAGMMDMLEKDKDYFAFKELS